MTTPRAVLPAPLLALVLACVSGSTDESGSTKAGATEPEQPVVRDPAAAEPMLPEPPTFASGSFELSIDGGPPIPPAKIVHDEGMGAGMQDHVSRSGWTTDGSAFAYCHGVSGEACELCIFTAPDGGVEKLFSGSMCNADGATKVSAKQLKQRLTERGVGVRDGDWAHGGELIVTARADIRASEESRSVLEVGAARRDGSAQGEAHREIACTNWSGERMCFNEIHAEAIVPSPDGARVAILAHMWEGEYSDTFALAIIPAGQLAAAAYNKQGLDALAAKDFEAAAKAFVAVMHADAKAWKGPYNLACAYARAQDPRARLALEVAVERGGDAVREKAAKDADLDAVRSQAWFTALIGAGE